MKYLKKFENHTQYEGVRQNLILPNISLCAQENEVHYNPDPYKGHAYVDLGLPSGTKWATMNVGATSETDYGLYFAWGETEGYADASTKAFSWSDYKFNPSGGDGSTMSKYNDSDGKTVLDLEDDAVAANWGGSWKMPTEAQFKELINNTNNELTTVNNVNGYKFTSKTDNTKYIFIPHAGYSGDGSVRGVGNGGCVWSSSLLSSDVKNGRYLLISSIGVLVYNYVRYYGCSVRGVAD